MNNRKIEGNYVVSADEKFHGMVTGVVTIKSGVKYINCGMLCNDVIVEEGASFYNHGMVTGNVMGEGYAEIWGMVKGHLSSMINAYVHKDSVINGKRYLDDEKIM